MYEINPNSFTKITYISGHPPRRRKCAVLTLFPPEIWKVYKLVQTKDWGQMILWKDFISLFQRLIEACHIDVCCLHGNWGINITLMLLTLYEVNYNEFLTYQEKIVSEFVKTLTLLYLYISVNNCCCYFYNWSYIIYILLFDIRKCFV